MHAHRSRQESRLIERVLLMIATGFMLVNFSALALQDGARLAHWLHLSVWLLCAWGGAAVRRG